MFFRLITIGFVVTLPISAVKYSVTPRGITRRVVRRHENEQENALSRVLDQNCRKQHPAHLAGVGNMSSRQVLECYARFHDATLAAWRAEPEKCKGRYVRVHRADHGLGDSGGSFLRSLKETIMHGDMILWVFPTKGAQMKERGATVKTQTVWENAMVAPFDWNLNHNKHLFCLENDTTLENLMDNIHVEYIVGKCSDCQDPRSKAAPTALQLSEMPFNPTVKEMWKFTYRPTDDVNKVVQQILGQVQKGERLIGVHFRSQWFGRHHSCGCMDAREAPRCMTNIGEFMQQRNISSFQNNPRLRYFVASDAWAGVDAFREAFGKDVLTLPDELPVEHSLFSTVAGSKRLLAEFTILGSADAVIGTCGSTFTQRLLAASGLPSEATITTGTKESQQCAALKNPTQNLQAFKLSRFTARPWSEACYCYGDEGSANLEDLGGVCEHACKKQEPPSLCKKDAPKSLMQASAVPAKPEWIPQERM